MKKISTLLLILFLTVFIFGGVSQALTLGNNITINDQMVSPSGSGVGLEDNECETGMIQSQAWDLEGFFLNNQMLSIVGGYDFKDGVSGYESGDIFINVEGVVAFGGEDITSSDRGYNPISNAFGYDFVIDIDFGSSTYDILKIDSSTTLTSVFYNDLNTGSNPWRYKSGGSSIASNLGLTFYSNDETINNAATGAGLSGWGNDNSHYGATFDISSIINTLTTESELTFHNTMGCGNDNLMGRTTVAPVPEPATIFLMFAGLLGLVGIRKRKK